MGAMGGEVAGKVSIRESNRHWGELHIKVEPKDESETTNAQEEEVLPFI
jgi:hypothetical protein